MRKKKPEIEDINLVGKLFFWLSGMIVMSMGFFIVFYNQILGMQIVIFGFVSMGISVTIPLVKNKDSMSLADAISRKMRGD